MRAWKAAVLGVLMGFTNFAVTVTLREVECLYGIYSFVQEMNEWKSRKERQDDSTQSDLIKKILESYPENHFNSYEKELLHGLVPASQLNVRWSDVGGCVAIAESFRSNVVYPLRYLLHHPQDINPLLLPPKGVLMYGPPGCGKTLLAKAVASEVNANFLSVDVSRVKGKWYGETEKLATAVFSLAYKLAPSIVFLDEVDCLLSGRGANDDNTDAQVKAIFLQCWDGLMTKQTTPVLILAASNRRDAIDPAFLRRLPLQLKVDKPEEKERLHILEIHLRNTPTSSNVNLKELAKRSGGMSGSELQEICRGANIFRLVDYMKEHGDGTGGSGVLRNLNMRDLNKALDDILKTSREDLPSFYL